MNETTLPNPFEDAVRDYTSVLNERNEARESLRQSQSSLARSEAELSHTQERLNQALQQGKDAEQSRLHYREATIKAEAALKHAGLLILEAAKEIRACIYKEPEAQPEDDPLPSIVTARIEQDAEIMGALEKELV